MSQGTFRFSLVVTVILIVFATLYFAAEGTKATPQAPPVPQAPDRFQVIGSWPLSDGETIRLVHVPDSPTGLRCLIYTGPKETTVRCDDDLPRGAPVSN